MTDYEKILNLLKNQKLSDEEIKQGWEKFDISLSDASHSRAAYNTPKTT